MRLIFAPLEGLGDDALRAHLLPGSGADECVTPFLRVSTNLWPARTFHALAPELRHNPHGVPLRLQLLGDDPAAMARHAQRAAALGAQAVDLNFGCPAPLVNRHGGGASLLAEPRRVGEIARAVRNVLPSAVSLTAKMRLGVEDTAPAVSCAQALADAGIDALVVHARTRADGYRVPARWPWLGRLREAVAVPVIANGDVCTVEDWERIRAVSGCADVMIGRGWVADPLLGLRIRGLRSPQPTPEDWQEIVPRLAGYWQTVRSKVLPHQAPGRLKLWLGYLARRHRGAAALFDQLRAEKDVQRIAAAMARFAPYAQAVA